MYKIVVSDFGGTLINSEEAISVSTMLELDRIRKAGIIFCITTSRSLKVVKDYNRDFPFIDYIVAFNGSYIYDVNNEKVIFDKAMSFTSIKKVYKLFSKYSMSFYTLDFCNYTGSYKENDYSELLIDVNGFIDENKKDIYKINIYTDSLKEAKNVVKKLNDNNIKVEVFITENEETFVVEITSVSNSKLKAIEKIAKIHKLKMKDVLAICSAASSCSLLEKVGCGCVVDNCDKSLRKVANEITKSNDDKGVENIIKKYF